MYFFPPLYRVHISMLKDFFGGGRGKGFFFYYWICQQIDRHTIVATQRDHMTSSSSSSCAVLCFIWVAEIILKLILLFRTIVGWASYFFFCFPFQTSSRLFRPSHCESYLSFINAGANANFTNSSTTWHHHHFYDEIHSTSILIGMLNDVIFYNTYHPQYSWCKYSSPLSDSHWHITSLWDCKKKVQMGTQKLLGGWKLAVWLPQPLTITQL